MAYSLIIKPIVFIDAEEAINYYQIKSKGLGNRFYQQIVNTLERIQTNPHTFSYVKEPVRRCIIKGFPYKIYYFISEDKIIVIGIAHAKRSNKFIKRKLGF